jgi:hypothetical protein
MAEHDPTDTESPDPKKSGRQAARMVEVNDIKWLMSHKQGRRFMWRLLSKAGIYTTSFTGNSETFFKEGMRNMGLFLVLDIHKHVPESYGLMVTESKEAK